MAASKRRHAIAAAITVAAPLLLLWWWSYSPGQDHPTSISLRGDGSWYQNYDLRSEIQDNDIFFHGIGHSIENARKADVIFLGTSQVLFAIDWKLFEKFESDHGVRMFDMAFAGVASGEFSWQLIQKWGLRPRLWIIDLYATQKPNDFKSSFFRNTLDSAHQFGNSMVEKIVDDSVIDSYSHVIRRNLRWRADQQFGYLPTSSYRSAVTGNWYLDEWPNRLRSMPKLPSREGIACPAEQEEIAAAHEYVRKIGGAVVLMQAPSIFSCSERIRDLAAALDAPAFTVDAARFGTIDGGGHMDASSAELYTKEFFAWLAQIPQFKEIETARLH
jgi:hypothetical protein